LRRRIRELEVWTKQNAALVEAEKAIVEVPAETGVGSEVVHINTEAGIGAIHEGSNR